jgi:hypothetical protein
MTPEEKLKQELHTIATNSRSYNVRRLAVIATMLLERVEVLEKKEGDRG